VVFEGTPADLVRCDESITAAHLRRSLVGTG
jgi:hypothetical protein